MGAKAPVISIQFGHWVSLAQDQAVLKHMIAASSLLGSASSKPFVMPQSFRPFTYSMRFLIASSCTSCCFSLTSMCSSAFETLFSTDLVSFLRSFMQLFRSSNFCWKDSLMPLTWSRWSSAMLGLAVAHRRCSTPVTVCLVSLQFCVLDIHTFVFQSYDLLVVGGYTFSMPWAPQILFHSLPLYFGWDRDLNTWTNKTKTICLPQEVQV